jgi:hypothetical protein
VLPLKSGSGAATKGFQEPDEKKQCGIVERQADLDRNLVKKSGVEFLDVNSDNYFPHTSPHLSTRGRSETTEKALEMK